jgi:hypothetical protein
MVGWQRINAWLPKDGAVTVSDIAARENLDVDHVRRVMHWMVGMQYAEQVTLQPFSWRAC